MTFAVVAISAMGEWRVVRSFYALASDAGTSTAGANAAPAIQTSPFGEYFEIMLGDRPVVVLHGGWGKIAAAASTQYALDRWDPRILVNLGTCGGFAGLPGGVQRGEILMVERTLVYDIIEQMGDAEAAVRHYAVDLDLSWLREPFPQPVRRSLLVSADRDICLPDIPMLVQRYGAVSADWESGAIAWTAARNAAWKGKKNHLLILRGVSDLVGESGGEAYGALEVFHEGARRVMEPLLQALPAWLDCASDF